MYVKEWVRCDWKFEWVVVKEVKSVRGRRGFFNYFERNVFGDEVGGEYYDGSIVEWFELFVVRVNVICNVVLGDWGCGCVCFLECKIW